MTSSAPKQFQKWISQVLEGTDGALCQIDDNLLVFDKMTEELDKHLEETPHKLQEANLTMNEETYEFFKSSVEYLASIKDSEGVRVDHKKVEAVMETPKDQSAAKKPSFLSHWETSWVQKATGHGVTPTADFLSPEAL